MNTPITKEVVWKDFLDKYCFPHTSVGDAMFDGMKKGFDEAWNHQQSKLNAVSLVIKSVADAIKEASEETK